MIVLVNILIIYVYYINFVLYVFVFKCAHNAIIILWLSLALMNNSYIVPWANILCNIGHISLIYAIDH